MPRLKIKDQKNKHRFFLWDTDRGLLGRPDGTRVSLSTKTKLGKLLQRYLKYGELDGYGIPIEAERSAWKDDLHAKVNNRRLLEDKLGIQREDHPLYIQSERGIGYKWVPFKDQEEAAIPPQRLERLPYPTKPGYWYRIGCKFETWVGEDHPSLPASRPRHPEWIENFAYLARFPVTNQVYADFIEQGGVRDPQFWPDGEIYRSALREGFTAPAFRHHPLFNGADHPVVGVSWYEAVAFCNWLTATVRNKPPPWWTEKMRFRLPDEAEWEWVARLGEPDGLDEETNRGRPYPWGDEEPTRDRANHAGMFGGTIHVGGLPLGATPNGILDLAGNAAEWCRNTWQPNYASSKERNHGQGAFDVLARARVIRGGHWRCEGWHLLASRREGLSAWARENTVGFRLCIGTDP